jgi:transcription elongation factor Elf1
MNNSTFSCPRCGSDNTSSFALIHSGGTSAGSFQGVSYGAKTGTIQTSGRTGSQSLLAQQTAPPIRPNFVNSNGVLLTVIVFVVACVISVFVRGFATSVFGDNILTSLISPAFVFGVPILFVIYHNKQLLQKRELWKSEKAQWEKSWMCLKCGIVLINKSQ